MKSNLKYCMISFPIVLATLASCILDEKKSGRGTKVENGVAGTLYDRDGHPVEGATIKVMPVDYVPKGGLLKAAADSLAVRSVKTGADGRYVLDSMPAGEYNILGELDGTFSYLDSIAYSETLDSLPSDTLRAPGSWTGFVRLEPNHDPRSVFIQVLGTNVFANADRNGRFTLREMAGGEYSLRILSAQHGYPPAFPTIRIRSGVDDTLETPIALAYTGIPVVRSLEVAYDTAAETATLRWPPVDYAFLREYLIFRTAKGALNLPSEPIAWVQDTFYTDSISRLIGWLGQSAELEYRVRVRNLSDSVGPAFATAGIRAMPRESVSFSLDFKTADSAGLRGGEGDTVPVVVGWQSISREADSLVWTMGDGRTIRSVEISGSSGKDTALVVLPEEMGPVSVRVRLLDRSGDAWEGVLVGNVENGMPIANAGSDTEVTISDPVNLRGKGKDPYGRIVRMEWDIGNAGNFVVVETGDTMVTASSAVSHQFHVLRVTDDDGNVDLDTMRVTARDDLPLVSLSSYVQPVSQGGGFLLKSATIDRGRVVKWEWDFGDSVFVSGPGPDTHFRPTAAGGTTLDIRVRITDDDGHQAIAKERISLSKWEYLADLPSSFNIAVSAHQEFRTAGVGSKLFVLAVRGDDYRDIRFASFEPSTGKWTTLTPPPSSEDCSMALVGANGKLYQITPSKPGNRNTGILEYDPRLGEWAWISETPVACGFTATVDDSTLYMIDGAAWGGRMYMYNLATGALNEAPGPKDAPMDFRISSSVIMDGSLYAIGTRSTPNPGIFMNIWSEESAEWVQAGSFLPGWMADPRLVAAGGDLFTMWRAEKSVYRYDRTLDKWSAKSPMIWVSSIGSASVLDGILYTIGDRKIQRYDPASER